MFMMFPVNRAAFFKIRPTLKRKPRCFVFNLGSHHKIEVAALNALPHKESDIFPRVKLASWMSWTGRLERRLLRRVVHEKADALAEYRLG
ncbi:hypothetical protein CEXT_696231 [Caerostris extrusa]|uniref:Uncharacterized protein n=1 Tax=Caerostris extrusa TaxID=172846 RepID=A0AAV4XGT5_CAEEX|nr:hypothetical protein CEXT_696231 [Caerostris extrusa]